MTEQEKKHINDETKSAEIPLEEPDTREEESQIGDSQPDTKELSEVNALKVRLEELNDRHLRLMAEYENYRKRSTREKDEIYPVAIASAVEKFFPVMDNLRRASQYERGTEEFAKGFDMICQSLEDVFKNLGVEAVGEVGEPFDPNLHNAVMHIEDPKLGENVVSQVLQQGYRIGDRMIRYAIVQTAN